MRATYWFRIVRNDMKCSVFVSYDGINYVNGLDLLLPVNTSDQQMIVIDGGNYDDAGSYIDYDFITTRRN
jgi:hypothetical protein